MVFDLNAFLERTYVTSQREMVALVDLMNEIRSELSPMERPLWNKNRLTIELKLRGILVARAVDRICAGLERRQPAEDARAACVRDADVQGPQTQDDMAAVARAG